jgi:hypothetical protein
MRTKPNPFGRPESRSVMRFTDSTTPHCANALVNRFLSFGKTDFQHITFSTFLTLVWACQSRIAYLNCASIALPSLRTSIYASLDILSDSFLAVFLVAVENFQEESSLCVPACVCVGLKGNRMSRKNGDRARFDRQRKAKIHNRTRTRELSKTVRARETTTAQNVDRPDKTLG